MIDNVHQMPKRAALTVEDAKLVQRYEEHLKALRRHRKFLENKKVHATHIQLLSRLSDKEVPVERPGGYGADGLHYRYAENEGWEVYHAIAHGKLNIEVYAQNGMVPTLGHRVMDGIRAAVADEIEATEKKIVDLGFAIPK